MNKLLNRCVEIIGRIKNCNKSVVLLPLLAFGLFACEEAPKSSLNNDTKSNVISLTGKAAILADHSEKANCPGIIVNDKEYLFKGQYKSFDKNTIGKEINVSGILVEKKLPMFIWDNKKDNPKKGMPQGIPMPPGTDIEKESIYYIIENPKWEIVESQKK